MEFKGGIIFKVKSILSIVYSQKIFTSENYDTLKKELQDLREKKMKGSIVRSRVEWVEERENLRSFFFFIYRSVIM